ncbi:MAG: 16S rRNA (guanine(966)-N(2))-methyltransferase RsmD [Chloroflexi bacterium]|nr:16S rRNA (guanine(966)-N(2))-methyltransferase RsmD [Chloroflexota bacterium]
MRVVGGVARGRALKSPPAAVRPTSDRVREAIFDALEARGAKFDKVLDAFAGSGALGIEALSRGDGNCDFIESNRKAAAVIRENLKLTGLSERGRVHQFRVELAPERLTEQYSLIFADPPYDDDTAIASVERLAESSLPGPKATLVLEHSSRSETPERLGRLRLDWSRRYGDTLVSMYGVAP